MQKPKGSEIVFFDDVNEHREDAEQLFAKVAPRIRELVPGAIVEHVGSASLPDGLTKGDLYLQVRVDASAYERACAALAAIYERNPGGFTDGGTSFKDDATEPPLGVHLTIVGGASDIQHAQRDLLRARPGIQRDQAHLPRR